MRLFTIVDTLRRSEFLRKLLLPASGTLILKAIDAIAAFTINLALARILGAEGFGAYAYAFAWAAFITTPAVFGIDKFAIREVARLRSQGTHDRLRGFLVWAHFVGIFLSSILALVSILILSFRPFFVPPEAILPTQIASLMLPLAAFLRIQKGCIVGFRKVVQGHFSEVALQPLLLLMIVLVSVQVGFPRVPEVYVFFTITSAVAASIVSFLILRRASSRLRVERNRTFRGRYWASATIPFVAISFAQVTYSQSDLLLVGALLEIQDVGVYKVVRRVSDLGLFIFFAVNSAFAPFVAETYTKQNFVKLQRWLTNCSRLIAVLTLPAVVFLLVFGDFILGLFGEEFRAGYWPLVILIVGLWFKSFVGSAHVALTMTGHADIAARIIWVTAGVNLVMNLILIPFFGLLGAALSLAFSLVLREFIQAYMLWRRTGLSSSVFKSRG